VKPRAPLSDAVILAGVLAGLVLLPHLLTAYQQSVLTEVMIWGLFAMAFDLLYGYTGMLSFGQAVFFGAGAYGTAFGVLRLGWGTWEALIFGIVLAAGCALVVGILAVRVSGHYFLILTITVSVVAMLVLQSGHWRWLSRGYAASPFVPPPVRLGPWELVLTDSLTNYYWVLALVVVSFLLCRRIVNSPLGMVFQGIRENEQRSRLIGYHVERFKLAAFVLAGGLSGLSGALLALTIRYVDISYFELSLSGKAVAWTVIGGAGTLIGAFLGALVFVVCTDYLSAWTINVPLSIGVVLIVTVALAPDGLLGILRGRLVPGLAGDGRRGR
jgi:branched-chain amino acid transport system permease protein